MKIFFYLNFFIILLAGCATSKPLPRPLDLPFSRIYEGTYDEVWEATLKVLDIYSISQASRESGDIRTEWGDYRYNKELFEYPYKEDRLEDVRSRIAVKLSKGVVAQSGDPAVRVQVRKELSEYRNFYSDWTRIPTDEVEEKIILYRIGQRLRIAGELKYKTLGSKAASGAAGK